jgi:hypothetical protein
MQYIYISEEVHHYTRFGASWNSVYKVVHMKSNLAHKLLSTTANTFFFPKDPHLLTKMLETRGPLDEIQWSDAEAVACYKGISAETSTTFAGLYFSISSFLSLDLTFLVVLFT